MARVLAVLGQKGGSGKSTILLSLAVEAMKNGRSVTIIDIDPQGTASKWGDRREAEQPVVVSAQAERLDKVMADITTDLIMIDTAGKADREGIAVSKRADLILIPCRPNMADVETLAAISELLALSRSTSKAAVVWNGALNPNDARISEAGGLVENLGLATSPCVIVSRVAFADALIAGQTASEIEPSGKAATEMGALYTWAMERI